MRYTGSTSATHSSDPKVSVDASSIAKPDEHTRITATPSWGIAAIDMLGHACFNLSQESLDYAYLGIVLAEEAQVQVVAFTPEENTTTKREREIAPSRNRIDSADNREGILRIPSCGHLLAASLRGALASVGKFLNGGRIAVD
jgi:hypothetical protein